jgi:hypothetical protein
MLLAGIILTPGRRTVTEPLHILQRECDPGFCTFHRIFCRAAWSFHAAANRRFLFLSLPLCQQCQNCQTKVTATSANIYRQVK